MNELLPVAKKMLSEFGEFYPYGGYMKLNGDIVHVGAKANETDHPKSTDLVDIIEVSLRKTVASRQCKAVAIVYNVTVTLPNSTQTSDAIQVCVEHINNYSAEVFFPYKIDNAEIVYNSVFAQQGENVFFAAL